MVSRWVGDGTETRSSVWAPLTFAERETRQPPMYTRDATDTCARVPPTAMHGRSVASRAPYPRRRSPQWHSPLDRGSKPLAGGDFFSQSQSITILSLGLGANREAAGTSSRTATHCSKRAGPTHPDRRLPSTRISAWIHTPPVDSASTARVIAVSTQQEGGFTVKKRVKKHGPARR